MKVIITNASEVRIDGQQSVSFNILDKGNVVVSSTIDGDVVIVSKKGVLFPNGTKDLQR